MKKTLVKSLALAFVGSLLVAGSALAMPKLDFGVVAPTTGSISYAGGSAALVGSGIDVDNVVGLNTVLNNGLRLDIFDGVLNFATGASDGAWSWGGGGNSFITVTGSVDLNNNHVLDTGDLVGATLLTGSFGKASITYNEDDGTYHIAGGSFTDYKNHDLLDVYGLPTTLSNGQDMPYSGNFNLSFNTLATVVGSAFRSTEVLSGDIVNKPVPEPATMLLLGTGLAGLAGARRRKSKK